MGILRHRYALAIIAVLALAAPFAHAQANWANVAFVSSTMGVNANRLCVGEASRGDIGCPTYAPSVDSAGLLTAGNISSTGNISANTFIGSGAGLTGVTANPTNRISTTSVASGATLAAVEANMGTVSFTLGGTEGAAYLHPTLGLVASGVSATGGISGSTGYFSNGVGIGTTTPSGMLHVYTSSSLAPLVLTHSNNIALTNTTGALIIQRIGSNRNLALDDNEIQARQSSLAAELLLNRNGGNVGIGNTSPTTILDISGTLRIANGGEACDSDRAGAIKYASSTFYFCSGSAWQSLGDIAAASSDRITSGTTNVYARTDGSISFTTAGTTTGYFYNGQLVANAVSTTGIGRFTNISNTGGISSTGNISANAFIGDGSLLTNVTANPTNRISTTGVASGATLAAVQADMGTVSFTLGGTAGAAYLHPTLGLVASGVSTTGPISGTSAVFDNRTNNAVPALKITTNNSFPDMVIEELDSQAAAQISLKNTQRDWQVGSDSSPDIFFIGVNGNQSTFVIDPNRRVAIGVSTPSTSLHVSGTLRISSGAEACDANRTGAIRYTGGEFSFCRNGTAWETMGDIASSSADRITSGTTNVYARTDGSISFTTAGTTTGYFYNGQLVAGGISTTGTISGTNGYFTGSVKVENLSNGRSVNLDSANASINAEGTTVFHIGRINPMTLVINPNSSAKVGINTPSNTPVSATLHVSGTIRIANGAETCDSNRTGAIRYTGGEFSFCRNGTAWETMGDIASTSADRITSGTTNVYARNDGSISFTTAGVTTGYFYNGQLVANGISTTGGISGSTGYFSKAGVNGVLTVESDGSNNAIVLKSLSNNREIWFSANAGPATIDMSSTAFHIGRANPVPLLLNPASSVRVGVNTVANTNPNTTLEVSGTLRLANGGETCDSNRTGAIRYNSGTFEFCAGSAWQSLSAVASAGGVTTNRISTTSVASGATLAAVQADMGTVSFTLGGTAGAAYLHPTLGLVASGVSTTGPISGTSAYFAGNVGIGMSATVPLGISSSVSTASATLINIKSGTGRSLSILQPDPNNILSPFIFFTNNSFQFVVDQESKGITINALGRVGVGTSSPTTLLQVSGTLRLADGGEACDSDRTGAIKYASSIFYFCSGSAWQSLSAVASAGGVTTNRISTTSVASGATLAAVQADMGTVSFTLGGTAGAAYLHPTLGLVASGVSTTGGISGTALYAANTARIGTTYATTETLVIGDGVSQNHVGMRVRATRRGTSYNNSYIILDGPRSDTADAATVSARGYIALPGNSTTISSSLFIGANTANGSYAGTADEMRANQMTMEVNSSGYVDFWRNSSNTIRLMASGESYIAGGRLGVMTTAPSTSLHVSGTLRIANGGEACNADRAGGIRYNSGTFEFCSGSAWQSLSAVASAGGVTTNRISTTGVASGATLAAVQADMGTVSFTLGGTAGAAYLHPTLGFVGSGVSTTGPISATLGYFSGQVVAGVKNGGSGTSFDWNDGNVQYTTADCAAFTFSNMRDGGMYNLVVQGAASAICTFSHTGLTFMYPTGYGATTASTHTVFTFLRAGTNVYVTHVRGMV